MCCILFSSFNSKKEIDIRDVNLIGICSNSWRESCMKRQWIQVFNVWISAGSCVLCEIRVNVTYKRRISDLLNLAINKNYLRSIRIHCLCLSLTARKRGDMPVQYWVLSSAVVLSKLGFPAEAMGLLLGWVINAGGCGAFGPAAMGILPANELNKWTHCKTVYCIRIFLKHRFKRHRTTR